MLGVLAAILVINILSYYRQKLYLSVLAGIILVTLINRFPLKEVFSLFYGSLTSSISINLALIIITFTAFGRLFKETGNLRIMVDNLALILRDRRHQVVALPALVGLLAFSGGAVFSAPLVEEAGAGLELKGTKLAVANMLFRHMFYLIFPFYSGLIFLSEISGISIGMFIRFNLLIVAAFFIFIYIYIFKGVKTNGKIKADFSQIPSLLQSLLPMAIILSLALGLNFYFPLAIIIGIIAAMLNYLPENTPLAESLKNRSVYLWRGINWSMAVSVMLILVLKDFMTHSGAIDILIDAMVRNGVPFLALAVILPFLTGFITGNQTASIGIAAPVFVAGVADPVMRQYLLGVVFVTSLAGYMGSPLHLCTILTAEYFKAPLQQVMKSLNALCLFLVGMSVVTFFLFAHIF